MADQMEITNMRHTNNISTHVAMVELPFWNVTPCRYGLIKVVMLVFINGNMVLFTTERKDKL